MTASLGADAKAETLGRDDRVGRLDIRTRQIGIVFAPLGGRGGLLFGPVGAGQRTVAHGIGGRHTHPRVARVLPA